jgi:hypothetical protein
MKLDAAKYRTVFQCASTCKMSEKENITFGFTSAETSFSVLMTNYEENYTEIV